MRTLLSWLSLGTLALAGLPAPAGAQPVGSEFQINTYTTSNQSRPSIASDASGNFVVVWQSRDQDGDFEGIFGQRYDNAGGTLGTEFRINTHTTSRQSHPSAASDASGNFVVVWQSHSQDGFNYGVFAQRYDSAGEALGSEFQVNTVTADDQKSPSVASDASGNFLVVWTSELGPNDVRGQRYDSAGRAVGSEFRVNSYWTGFQYAQSVAADANGNFVVVWTSALSYYGSGKSGVFGQRYDADGVAQGPEFLVTTQPFASASVASDASGNFVVVWARDDQDLDDDVFGQRYDRAGLPLGGRFLVNSTTTADQKLPSVASDASGSFLVAWQSDLQDGSSSGIFGQRYDSGGMPQGNEFQISSFTTGAQNDAFVRVTGTNQFVVAWQSYGQDGSDYGVFGKRYALAGETVTVVSPNTNVKWRVGSLQKIQWTHNLGADATFRIELDRDDDGDYEELIAAGAPVDSATKGGFAWSVTGPRSGTARVRVAWTDDLSVSDASDVTFQIRPVGLD